MNGKEEKYIQIFSRKTGENRPFGRTGHRLKDNIKMYLQETKWGCEEDSSVSR